MNWRIRLTWWDKALLAVMAVAVVITVVRFAAGIGSTCRRLTAIGVLVAGLGWFFGMLIAVALERPIF